MHCLSQHSACSIFVILGFGVTFCWFVLLLLFNSLPFFFLPFQALNAEEARLLQVKEIMQLDERKRPYNSVYETREPTEEEMEAYRMKRQRPDDPMASFLGQ